VTWSLVHRSRGSAAAVQWLSSANRRVEHCSSPVESARALPRRWRWRQDQADAESDAGVSAERSIVCVTLTTCSAYCQQGCTRTALAAERHCRRQLFCSTVTDCAVMMVNRTTSVRFSWHLIAVVVTIDQHHASGNMSDTVLQLRWDGLHLWWHNITHFYW